MEDEFRTISEFPDYEINREGVVRRIRDRFEPKKRLSQNGKESLNLRRGGKWGFRKLSNLIDAAFNTPESLESLDILGFPEYGIDYEGNVWTYRYHKYVSTRLIGRGYLGVSLYGSEGYKPFLVHRLMALRFIPNPEKKPTVNHIDGDKLNNCILNLEWATHKENNNHAIYNGLRDTILSVDKVHEICEYIQNKKETVIRNIENKFNISWDQASEIYHKRSWAEITKEYNW